MWLTTAVVFVLSFLAGPILNDFTRTKLPENVSFGLEVGNSGIKIKDSGFVAFKSEDDKNEEGVLFLPGENLEIGKNQLSFKSKVGGATVIQNLANSTKERFLANSTKERFIDESTKEVKWVVLYTLEKSEFNMLKENLLSGMPEQNKTLKKDSNVLAGIKYAGHFGYEINDDVSLLSRGIYNGNDGNAAAAGFIKYNSPDKEKSVILGISGDTEKKEPMFMANLSKMTSPTSAVNLEGNYTREKSSPDENKIKVNAAIHKIFTEKLSGGVGISYNNGNKKTLLGGKIALDIEPVPNYFVSVEGTINTDVNNVIVDDPVRIFSDAQKELAASIEHRFNDTWSSTIGASQVFDGSNDKPTIAVSAKYNLSRLLKRYIPEIYFDPRLRKITKQTSVVVELNHNKLNKYKENEFRFGVGSWLKIGRLKLGVESHKDGWGLRPSLEITFGDDSGPSAKEFNESYQRRAQDLENLGKLLKLVDQSYKNFEAEINKQDLNKGDLSLVVNNAFRQFYEDPNVVHLSSDAQEKLSTALMAVNQKINILIQKKQQQSGL
jgi:hypothetical protein